ncbi:MAG: COP9 signalosome (CSN) subunit [Alyxoria varia]|nr:MAG: COP9 signalosome (CSN) subunit [Alyxoria varia]
MNEVYESFVSAYERENGDLLSATLVPAPTRAQPTRLDDIARSSSVEGIDADVRYATIYNNHLPLEHAQKRIWHEIYVAYWHAVCAINYAEQLNLQFQGRHQEQVWSNAYEAWKEVSNALLKAYNVSNPFEVWTVPCLYIVGKHLRMFAIKADEETKRLREGGGNAALGVQSFGDDIATEQTEQENDKLEDAARLINRMFMLCYADRSSISESRKWAIYYISNLLFKTYFKLNKISLSENIIRSLEASTADMPPLSAFPKSHICTYHYYHGVILFLKEDYPKAEAHLVSALGLCPRTRSPSSLSSDATLAEDPAVTKNRRLILTYLIPTRLITSRKIPSFPSPKSSSHTSHTNTSNPLDDPHLTRLFRPLCLALRSGDLRAYDAALLAGEFEFIKRRIYLTLERAREICERNLLRKVRRIVSESGFPVPPGGRAENEAEGELRKRIEVNEFWAGLRVGLKGFLDVGQQVSGGVVDAAADGSDDAVMDGEDDQELEELDRDEAECIIANLICRGLIKGNINRYRGMVMMKAGDGAFPGTERSSRS